ncbi:MAG: hypothetical protein ABEJ34_05460 [Haloferacaceae archaeon]
MTAKLTLAYRADSGTRFRVRVRPNDEGPGWVLIKERRIGEAWHRVSREWVADVYVDADERVLL